MNTNGELSRFPHPHVAVDILIFGIIEDQFKVVLVKRNLSPFKDSWALPGGFVRIDESLEEAAIRELVEETGVKNVYLEQLYTFGDVDRDPRDRVVSVSYFALVASAPIKLQAATDAKEVAWFSVNKLPKLAFDHQKIVNYGIERVKNKLGYSTLAKSLLPKKFRLSELQKVYEVILGTPVDKRNFRKKMLSLELVKPLGEKVVEGRHRPAMLYSFKDKGTIIFK